MRSQSQTARLSSLRNPLLPGLAPEALQAEMQRGQVCCLVETGVDEDEGRTGVTVRYHARSLTLVIEPDGKERATTWSASAVPLKTRATSLTNEAA